MKSCLRVILTRIEKMIFQCKGSIFAEVRDLLVTKSLAVEENEAKDSKFEEFSRHD